MMPGDNDGKQESERTVGKGIDKFLIAIVVGAIFLVVVVFIVVLTRPERDYLPEDTPEGVAHNYLFAIEEGDYQRAYGYLSPLVEGLPQNPDEFLSDVEDFSYSFNQDRVKNNQIESVNSGEEAAVVTIRETTFYEGGIFGSNEYSSTFKIHLSLENGEWKIFDADRYFPRCWQYEDGCH